ncbi:MAG: catalase [Chloroflexota bacterium]|jgi:catalase|nr:catalase [Chloroflexota bacterium]
MDLPAGLAKELVDTLHSVHGEHPGHRAAHAKGSCATGTFTASPEAAALTRAAHMQGDPVPVTIRFSNGSGIPAYPDYARSDGRGLAVKFHLPDGGSSDMVALTLPVFFARDPESFMEFLRVTRPDPETKQPDLAAVGAFLERHPETQAALGAAMAGTLPASYLMCRYNGIHAFQLVDAGGGSRWVRYHWDPEAGERTLTPEEAREGGREYLQEELRERISRGPAALRLVFVLGREGDSLVDPTQAWPDDREEVIAGRLEVSAVAEPGTCEPLVFDPTNVVDGIALPDDPILHARSVAYARSFASRRGIRAPSTPSAHPLDAGPRALEAARDLAPGAMRAVEVGDARVAVANVDGTLRAFQDTCTHRGCSLTDGTLSGGIVTCPCHGSQFDVGTGEVVRGPASERLATFSG